MKVKIQKTEKKGWGELTDIFWHFLLKWSFTGVFVDGDEFIPKNTFVGVYAGEYITIQEAERREEYVCLLLILFQMNIPKNIQGSTQGMGTGHIFLILTLTLIYLERDQ